MIYKNKGVVVFSKFVRNRDKLVEIYDLNGRSFYFYRNCARKNSDVEIGNFIYFNSYKSRGGDNSYITEITVKKRNSQARADYEKFMALNCCMELLRKAADGLTPKNILKIVWDYFNHIEEITDTGDMKEALFSILKIFSLKHGYKLKAYDLRTAKKEFENYLEKRLLTFDYFV